MRFLVIFIFILSSATANEVPNIKNLVINKELKIYDNISFLDDSKKIVKLSDYKDNFEKSEKFFKELSIKNLKIYFDNSKTLAKDLVLRGVPTTIFFNKEGKEFARVIGSIDFEDKKFVQWIKKYN